MAYFTQEQVGQAREMDLLTYLKTHEPMELVHVHGNEYCTREHDSLKISNGKWMWWSRGFGGHNALSYLMQVQGLSFIDACQRILGTAGTQPSATPSRSGAIATRKLLLPDENETTAKITEYLTSRGIDEEILRWCIREKLLFESSPQQHCIFVGYDKEGMARYAFFRSTGKERFMGEASGSDKRYSFRIHGPGSDLHLFESAIDLLSYATLVRLRGGNWRASPLLSLGGVHAPKGKDTGRLPIALDRFLAENPQIKTIALHLDNDHAGRSATLRLTENLRGRFEVRDETPFFGKDVNDELLHHRATQKAKER